MILAQWLLGEPLLRMLLSITGFVPDPEKEKDKDRKASMNRSLNYMGLKPIQK